jgi:hypothetical protein
MSVLHVFWEFVTKPDGFDIAIVLSKFDESLDLYYDMPDITISVTFLQTRIFFFVIIQGV